MTDYKKITSLEKPEDLFNMKDRVILILGGAGKMANQFGKTLALSGAKLVLADNREDAVRKAAMVLAKKRVPPSKVLAVRQIKKSR